MTREGRPKFIPLDGYYIVTPIVGSHWAPIITRIYNNGTKEDYINLSLPTNYVVAETIDLPEYYNAVVSEGGTIQCIPEEKYEALVNLYK